MSYQYSDYPYNLQADEMFDFTDISTAETAAALNEYQNLIINGQIDEAAQYLRDDTTGLKNCLIGAEVINTLQQRIHAVQDYALSLKTQGWYSEDAHDLDAKIRLKGTMFRVKTGEYEDGVITDEYIKTETGGDYVKNYSNGLIYYENGLLKGKSPIESSPKALTSSADGAGNIDVDLQLWNDNVLSTKLPIADVMANYCVTDVKGNNESTYRRGKVNLTPANIGAVNTEGDSMTGALRMRNGQHIYFYNSNDENAGYVYAFSNTREKYIALAASNESNIRIAATGPDVTLAANRSNGEIDVVLTADGFAGSVSGAFCPAGGSSLYLGNNNARWQSVYAVNGTIQTSDRNEKHDIKPISEVYEKLFTRLQPVSYVLNNGERTHIGFISQDVESVMNELGLNSNDFAGFCKDEVDGQTYYGLRYGEFIALNTHMIQKLMKRVDELESRQ